MSDVLGPDSFNGLLLFAAAIMASVFGLLLTLGLAAAWALRRSEAGRRRARTALGLTLANSAAVGLLYGAMEYLGYYGPRLPRWIDWLGVVWVVAFAALLAMMLVRAAHPSSPQDSHQ